MAIDRERRLENARRYRQSEKGREANRRYNQSEKRRNMIKIHNDRRIMYGKHEYVGMAKSVTEAGAINAHIKGRLNEFKQGLAAGAEAQGTATGAVPPETAA
jgi:hypothetical protein